MDILDDVELELTAVVGAADITLGAFLRLGRGAVIALDTKQTDAISITYRDLPIALGDVVVDDDRIQVCVQRLAPQRRPR